MTGLKSVPVTCFHTLMQSDIFSLLEAHGDTTNLLKIGDMAKAILSIDLFSAFVTHEQTKNDYEM